MIRQSWLRASRLVAFAVALVVIGFGLSGSHAAGTLAAPAEQMLQLHFEAHGVSTIVDGTSNTRALYEQATAINYAGTLAIDLRHDGRYDGALTLDEGGSIPVYGRVSDLEMTIVLNLGDGAYVVGTGATTQSLLDPSPDTSTTGGGTFLALPEDRLGIWEVRILPYIEQ